jgi:hypothetical protein
LEFTAGVFDPSAYAGQVVVSELMYHAADPTLAERAAAAALSPAQVWNDDSFDYVELRNVSAGAIDLTGFEFTSGFDYVFPAGSVMGPGASLVVVANADAFRVRYGAGRPVAGAWNAKDRLSNAGETLTLQFGLAVPAVFSFAYSDNGGAGWPVEPGSGWAWALVPVPLSVWLPPWPRSCCCRCRHSRSATAPLPPRLPRI